MLLRKTAWFWKSGLAVIRSHFFGVVICTVGFTAAVIVWLVSRRKKLEEDTERIINDWGIPF